MDGGGHRPFAFEPGKNALRLILKTGVQTAKKLRGHAHCDGANETSLMTVHFLGWIKEYLLGISLIIG